MTCKTLYHNSLGAKHVIRRQVGVRGAARYDDRMAFSVDHLSVHAIARAHPTQVTDVVCQGSDNEVQPIVLGHISVQTEPAQDVLGHESYQSGMLRVVIKSIAGCESFDHQTRGLVDGRGNALISTAETPDKCG